MGNVKQIEMVEKDGRATNQMKVWFNFLNSPYLVTVERIKDDDAAS